ncbi:MAG: 2-oxoacid:acceptor oxidoreductase family protein [Leptospirillum sp.]|jgi:pyruvate ferredoxin oxidoreductase gamma subunit|nr:2-oxoacid:acceptor oxidoreductase family protein [Nitrospiraceae bacterium]
MIGIRIHGRGGQGSVSAAYLLALAAFESGLYAQAFPSFGAERRGAPISAFVRIDKLPFARHCQILSPDFLIVLDDSLLFLPETLRGFDPSGGILANSGKQASDIMEKLAQRGLSIRENMKIATVKATEISLSHLGKPIPNTVLVSAFLSLTGTIPGACLEKALARRFSGKTLEANLTLVREAAVKVEKNAWAALPEKDRSQARA